MFQVFDARNRSGTMSEDRQALLPAEKRTGSVRTRWKASANARSCSEATRSSADHRPGRGQGHSDDRHHRRHRYGMGVGHEELNCRAARANGRHGRASSPVTEDHVVDSQAARWGHAKTCRVPGVEGPESRTDPHRHQRQQGEITATAEDLSALLHPVRTSAGSAGRAVAGFGGVTVPPSRADLAGG